MDVTSPPDATNSTVPISVPGSLRQMITSLQPLMSPSRRALTNYTNRLHSRHFLHLGRNRRQSNADQPIPTRDNNLATTSLTSDNRAESAVNRTADANSTIIEIDDNLDNPAHRITDESVDSDHSQAVSNSSSSSDTDAFHDSSSSSSLVTAPGETTADPENGEMQANDAGQNDQSSRNPSDSISDMLNQFPELRNGLIVLWRYFIFLLIILAKAMFDHITGLLVIVVLAIGFIWSNTIVKKSVSIQGRRPIYSVVVLVFNIPVGIFFLYHFYHSEKLYYSILLVPPNEDKLSFCDLLWLVIVTDYTLKLVTVQIKAFITLMPKTLLRYPNRGKYFLVLEMISQLYRSLVPIQPWISYLLDSYVGPRKVLGMLLSVVYVVCKGPDLVNRWGGFRESVVKLLQSVNYGSIPSKAQVEDAGGLCPICHDQFLLPTMLQCKHIFCEQCVVTWFDRERTCPMCRTQVADDPSWRDGGTSHYLQLY